MVYSCAVNQCIKGKQITVDRQFLFKHYITHLKHELVRTAFEIGVPDPRFENKYTLINSIIDYSMMGKRA